MRDDIAMTTGNSQESDGPDITDLGNDVYQIDTRMAGYQGITAGYLIRSSRPCLVETGTSTSAPVVQAALASLGIGASDLATVVVTHIHLDHAGGAGDIASMFGGATGGRDGVPTGFSALAARRDPRAGHQPARVGQVPRALLVHHDLRAAEHRGDVAHAARVVQMNMRDDDGSEIRSPDPERGERGLHDRR